ncbi:MAG: flavin reductase family protein [Alphaproteobacteria bacterium]|nr:flavin reductase family protein [Alphaproteobacteria bacterium]
MDDVVDSIDSRRFREVCGAYATGVAVVTAVDAAGTPTGVTVNSFSSVSLNPPLVQFSLDRGASVYPVFETADHFAVNVLAREQEWLSARFSTDANHFVGVEYIGWDNGCPIIQGCLANFECSRYALHDGGDHVIILGHVRRLECVPAGEPLLFHRGQYGSFI